MRRKFQAIVAGLLLLGASAPAAASPSVAPALAETYNSQTGRSFRVGLQMRLAWAGDYAGGLTGDIDAPSLRAIRDFQARHAMDANGIIDEAFLRLLIAVSDEALAQAGFAFLNDASTGVRVGLPLGLVRDNGPTEVGHLWRSDDRAIEIETVRFAGPEQTVRGLFEFLRVPTADRSVTAESFGEDGFTISGHESGRRYTMRFAGRDGDVRGVSIAFDELAASRMRPVTVIASNTFEPFAAEPDVELVASGQDDAGILAASATRSSRDLATALPGPSFLQTGIDRDGRSSRDGNSAIASSGTGFVVSKEWLLTNAHVAEACGAVQVGNYGSADRVIVDKTSDLALIHIDADLGAPLPISTEMPRLGEDILALGYPLRSILADSLNVTRGNISSLMGLQNDARYLQISAAVQPGNSGGPLVDLSGRVVGVVTAKLNAVAIADATGDIPQSINFAIQPEAAVHFLESAGIEYTVAGGGLEVASVADVTERVQHGILPVLCMSSE